MSGWVRLFCGQGSRPAALLEILDPEQNGEFRDNYLEVAYDLSQVFFIATANMLEYIPGPLRDRMEMIYLSGYTESEKLAIARGYLIPRQIRENSLRKNEITFNDEALKMIIRQYTREAGVRNLERKIGAVCRKVGTHIAEGKAKKYRINPKLVESFLDTPIFLGPEELNKLTSITGGAWSRLDFLRRRHPADRSHCHARRARISDHWLHR